MRNSDLSNITEKKVGLSLKTIHTTHLKTVEEKKVLDMTFSFICYFLILHL